MNCAGLQKQGTHQATGTSGSALTAKKQLMIMESVKTYLHLHFKCTILNGIKDIIKDMKCSMSSKLPYHSLLFYDEGRSLQKCQCNPLLRAHNHTIISEMLLKQIVVGSMHLIQEVCADTIYWENEISECSSTGKMNMYLPLWIYQEN